jgi:hypothetical protein
MRFFIRVPKYRNELHQNTRLVATMNQNSSLSSSPPLVWLVRTLGLAALLFSGVTQAVAATYYVDFSSGSNSNAGTTATAPWKHCPGDANATGNPAKVALAAGDTVLFKGGTTYVGSISLSRSGSSSAPITFDGTTWNGLRATISTNNSPGGGFSTGGVARDNLVIKGFRFYRLGGYADDDPVWSSSDPVTNPPGGSGISLLGGGSNIKIVNCEFAEIGQWRNVKPMSGINSVTGIGISLENNTNVLISDCDFTRMKTGVSVKATSMISDITIRNSSFHNYMNWLIDVAPRKVGATLRNITIESCRFFDYKEFDTPNWQGFGEKPHQDGIFFRTAGMSSTWQNVVVRNCVFSSDQTSNGGTASIYISEGPSVDIYNCSFLNDVHANANINFGFTKPAGMTQTIRVWNCTFVGNTTAFRGGNGSANPDVVEFINNVVYRTTSTNAYVCVNVGPSSIGKLRMDNNLYFKDAKNIDTTAIFYDGGYLTLEQWRSRYGQDKNSMAADPQLINLSGSPSTWNPRLKSSSPAIKAGLNLLSAFSYDAELTSRTESWDIGAYSFSSGGKIAPPEAPTGLKVLSSL